MKQILNLNIEDYKKYSQEESSIEIEIIPIQNKIGKFINIEKGKEKFYHIYFNDNKNEGLKQYFINKKEQINKINIIIDSQVKSFCKLFQCCKCIESIYFQRFYRTNINDMSYMFDQCSFLQEIDFVNFKADNVISMKGMFRNCSSLKQLNLSNFTTSNVKDMSNVFEGCLSLKEINISNFNTEDVEEMSFMFSNCSSLKELILSNFNTN